MLDLRVELPKVRDLPGWLRVMRDGRQLAEFRVLGRGGRGAGDTTILVNGNTPTGTYRITGLLADKPEKYGRGAGSCSIPNRATRF